MRIGGDPDQMQGRARHGHGQAFTLDVMGQQLGRAGDGRGGHPHDRHRARLLSDELRRLAQQILVLERWTSDVAHALRSADGRLDTGDLRARVLELGPGPELTPLRSAVAAGVSGPLPDHAWAGIRFDEMSDAMLHDVGRWSEPPTSVRDALGREQIRRHLVVLDERVKVAAAHAALVQAQRSWRDHGASWIDRHLLDRFDSAITLHVSAEDAHAALAAEAAGLRWLLRQPDLVVLDLDPAATADGQPTVRVATGDPDHATHIAMLVPGTGSGVAAPSGAVRDLRAVTDALHEIAGAAQEPVAVLELYDAPGDLAHAADESFGNHAGDGIESWVGEARARQTARQTARQGGAGLVDHRGVTVTLIGHSYGAFTAGRAATAGASIDQLVALGAPGMGVVDARQLGLPAGAVFAGRATGDLIVAVADLDEFIGRFDPDAAVRQGPLGDPLAALGPDPMDAEFGAMPLHTDPGAGDSTRASVGHVDYLTPGTASLRNVAIVTLGRAQTRPATARPAAQNAPRGR
ncbi:MAG: hypothetical protein ACJA2H_001548 [Nitriliruptoraceae bacterium]